MADQTDNKAVECGFDGTPITRFVILAMAFIPLVVLLCLFANCVDISSVGGLCAYLGCVAVMVAALIIKLKLGRGRITAEAEYVNVHYGFLSRKIPYYDITCVLCDVETQNDRYGITYTMVLTIETSEKKYYYEHDLDVEDDFPAKHPEEYRKYLDRQPMRQVCEYIRKECKRTFEK